MANVIRHKRGTSTPAVGDFTSTAELLVNTTDGSVYTKTDSNAVAKVGEISGDIKVDSASVGTDVVATTNTVIDVNGSYAGNIVAVSALAIDCSAGNYFTKTISANSTFTFGTVPSSRAYSFVLELTHTSGNVTWPTSVAWPASTAPTLTTGKTHLFVFVTDDGGTRWRGASLVDYTT